MADNKDNVLLKSRSEVRTEILALLEEGRRILATPIESTQDLEGARKECRKWEDRARQVLQRRFSDPETAKELSIGFRLFLTGSNVPLATHIRRFQCGLSNSLSNLESIEHRLDLYEECLEISDKVRTRRVSADGRVSDGRSVFVVHGRDSRLQKSMFDFLSALGLRPKEWPSMIREAEQGAPYVGDVVALGLRTAQAVVVLMTGDDIACLHPALRSQSGGEDDAVMKRQSRPNVLLEAGMAMALLPGRTVLVKIGDLRSVSDLDGRHEVRMDGSTQRRKELVEKLKACGCDVDDSGDRWLDVGDFAETPLDEREHDSVVLPESSNRDGAQKPDMLRKQLLGFRQRVKEAVESSEVALAPDLAMEMAFLGRRIWIAHGLGADGSVIDAQFTASLKTHAGKNGELGLLKITLNAAQRWLEWIDSRE